MTRAAVLAAASLAVVLTLAYATILAAEGWHETTADDQGDYLALALGIAQRGEFTASPVGVPFAPESYRLPGYPALLAPLCLHGCSHSIIAGTQAILYGALVVLSYALARRYVAPPVALAGAFAVATYLPFAYFSALALSDVPGTLLLVAALLSWVRAREIDSPWWAAVTGVSLGWTSLMRAMFGPFIGVLVVLALARHGRRQMGIAFAALVAFAVVVVPYIAYAEVQFGRPFAGTGASLVWYGYFQGTVPEELDAFERAHAESGRARLAEVAAMPASAAKAHAWLALNDELGRDAQALIAHDLAGYLGRSVARSFELWAGDWIRPARGAFTAWVEFAMLILGGIGIANLARARRDAAVVAGILVAYVWLLSLPFYAEGRYAFPAKVVLLTAVVPGLETLTQVAARLRRL